MKMHGAGTRVDSVTYAYFRKNLSATDYSPLK